MRISLFCFVAMVGVFLYAQNDTTYIYKGNSVNEDSLLLYFDGTNVYSGDSHNVIGSVYNNTLYYNNSYEERYACFTYFSDYLIRGVFPRQKRLLGDGNIAKTDMSYNPDRVVATWSDNCLYKGASHSRRELRYVLENNIIYYVRYAKKKEIEKTPKFYVVGKFHPLLCWYFRNLYKGFTEYEY